MRKSICTYERVREIDSRGIGKEKKRKVKSVKSENEKNEKKLHRGELYLSLSIARASLVKHFKFEPSTLPALFVSKRFFS